MQDQNELVESNDLPEQDVEGLELFTEPVPESEAKGSGSSGKALKPRYIRFTPDGESINVDHYGRILDMPPSIPSKKVEPIKDHAIIEALYGMTVKLREMKNRMVPVTRGELIKNGIDKSVIRRLVKAGFVKERLISLRDGKTRKKVNDVACVYLTAEGRCYVQNHIDPGYKDYLYGFYNRKNKAITDQEPRTERPRDAGGAGSPSPSV